MANLARLVDRLLENPLTNVQLVQGSDDVCCFCPHMEAGICVRAEYQVNSLDARVIDHLGLALEESYSWSSLLDTISARVAEKDIPILCGDCRWLKLSYCSDGLARLAASKKPDAEPPGDSLQAP